MKFALLALIASALPGFCVAADLASTSVQCPATLDSSYKPQPGSRLIGAEVQGSRALAHASMATGTPADQHANALSEFEQDEEATKDGFVTYTYYYETTAQSPLSVICAYGEAHGAKTSLLLLPVPSDTKGICKFRMPSPSVPDTPAKRSSMTCDVR
ncbi:hypothetical protein [Bordetella sp. LUAb4]|uniref:hypothetical protein n=1 Tax=Bordetella sp. LUAb4 TaxID=2843195 RepID=UPI001E3C0675|nr:hypothetical protein [Bordetella sp. LUAb4]